jgi:hypothetical protein
MSLQVGQRTDVLFTPRANGTQAIWMRTLQSGKFCQRAANPEGRAVILLDNTSETAIPTTTAWPPPVDDGTCKNEPLENSVPYYAEKLPEPSVTYKIVMNGYPFQADYNDPLLLLANEKNYSYPYNPEWNVINFGQNTSIRLVIWNNNTGPHVSHFYTHPLLIKYLLANSPCISTVTTCLFSTTTTMPGMEPSSTHRTHSVAIHTTCGPMAGW